MSLPGAPDAQLAALLPSLVREHPEDTGPQLLWRLQQQGLPLDPLRDAARVRAMARELKGPLPEPAAGLNGAVDTLLKMQGMLADWPDFVSLSVSLGGGPKAKGPRGSGGSVRGRQQPRTSGIADWPEFFLDAHADVHGKDLKWVGEETKTAPSSKKAKSQKERRQAKQARANAAGAAGSERQAPHKDQEEVQSGPGPVHNDELYIWLIDAYRMRCHDDLQWRGGIRRGIYEQMVRVERRLRPLSEAGVLVTEMLSDLERITVGGVPFAVERDSDTPTAFPTRLSVAQDFFLFCKLVEQREKYPPDFDFARLLTLAQRLLPKRFQKDHAKFKYGDENAMSTDRPSLRRFAETIYGTTVQQQHVENERRATPDTGQWFDLRAHEYDAAHRYPPGVCRLWESVERLFEVGIAGALQDSQDSSPLPPRRAFLDSVELLFADVGGAHVWRQLFESLDLVRDNFGLPHACAVDQHVPLGSTVLLKSLRGTKPTGPNFRRPVDFNGALGTLVKVQPPSTDRGKLRFQVVVNDGTPLALQARNLLLSIEKKGEMSAYARMHLNLAGHGALAADLGGYSSLSEEEEAERGRALRSPSARSAAFRRQRGLENIGEARQLEEGGRRAACSRMYDFAEAQNPDGELIGCVVTLTGLVNSAELNGRLGRVVARKESQEGEEKGSQGSEARFIVELDGGASGQESERKVVKRRHLQFVDAREVWGRERGAPGTATAGKGKGKGKGPGPARSETATKSEAAAEVAGEPGVSSAPARAKGAAKSSKESKAPQSVQVKAKAKPEPVDWQKAFPPEDSARLRALLQEELGAVSGTRLSARQMEERLREKASKASKASALLDVAKRYVEAMAKVRSKKQAKLDRLRGMTGRTHWLGRFVALGEPSACEFHYDFKANAFCHGLLESEGEGEGESEGESEGEGEADAEEPCGSDAEGEGAKEEEEAPAARDGEAAALQAPALPAEALRAPIVPAAVPAHEAQEAYPKEETEEAGAPQAPQELFEIHEPVPERTVHRYYGCEAGSVFFIPPCELYFTQDSCSHFFRDAHSSGYSSGASTGGSGGEGAVKASTMREMFDSILAGSMRKREVEMMDVVFHEGYYYSICNRRLAAYLLLWLCGRCPRLKVQLVSKGDRHVNWGRRFTTECYGNWIWVRQTGEAIGRRFEDTSFKHPELTRAEREAKSAAL